VCHDVQACPAKMDALGQLQQAKSCSTGSLVPTAEELADGKALSCACGGDAATEQLCQAREQSSHGRALS